MVLLDITLYKMNTHRACSIFNFDFNVKQMFDFVSVFALQIKYLEMCWRRRR